MDDVQLDRPAVVNSEAVEHFAEQVARTSGLRRATIALVVRDELERGRIVERDGHLELVVEQFAPGVLTGLRQMTPGLGLDPDADPAARRNGQPRLGWSARQIQEIRRLPVKKAAWAIAHEAEADHRGR
jgi:hypothetical protein